MSKYSAVKKLKTLNNMIEYLIFCSQTKEDENLPLKDLYPFLKSMLDVIIE